MTKTKKSNLFFALFCSGATLLAIITTWTIQSFLSKTQSHVYFNFIFVLIQVFFQGITKNWNQPPLLKGLPYLISSQIIGTIFGIVLVYFTIFGLEKYSSNEKLTFSMYKDNKSKDPNVVYFKNLFKYKSVSYSRHTIKEFIFLAIFIITISFINYINDVKFQTNIFYKTLIVIFILMLVLILSSEFNFFMFSVYISLTYLVCGALTRKVTKNEIINFCISFGLTIVITIFISLMFLLFANKAKITFSLS
ncbi:Uncharacterised protein [Mesomycoplasma neurolyticum]|uniref:Uncharacterized protein n=1 Tax=Mesomycoplasma neurolyticum TaxID=2120 RepID=A0A449A4K3_9BACT|nr:hypothetical protein [Mesomycoplasma neurolyticum]VEU59167.1 Uncharacterised protein [Mesomycoplasma neurolyticum]